jgi:hypothetical protein
MKRTISNVESDNQENLVSTQEYQDLEEDNEDEQNDKNFQLKKQPSNPSQISQAHSKILYRNRVFPKKYFILAHGQLAKNKFPFNIQNVKHITKPGKILLTKVYRNEGSIVFPLLHHVCNDRVNPTEDITEDFILGSSKETWEYDGVYLCKNGIASRIMKFKDLTIKKRLSSVVKLICDYNNDKMDNGDYTVGVLTCLKESKINPDNKNPSFCDYKGLSSKNCKELELNPGECVIIGGKAKGFIKNKKTRKKHSRKKTLHTRHRRR